MSRPNILYLTHRVPYPPNRGDRIRSYHVLRYLAERADVHLACVSEEPVEEGTLSTLDELCKTVAVLPLGITRWLNGAWSLATGKSATEGLFRSRRLRRLVRGWMSRIDFDAVLVFCSSMYQFTQSTRQQPRTVVDLVDVDSQKWLDYARDASGVKRLLFNLEGRRVRKLESRIASNADSVVLVSEEETRLFQDVVGAENAHAVTNGVDTDYFQPAQCPVNPHECVFVGVLDYRANVEGLRWFCREVWPQVRQRFPDATFRIVGRRPNDTVKQLGHLPGVELVGEVEDVRQHVARAAVTVAPLLVARGIQNKVLESLAMGKAVVASSQALEGISLVRGEDAIEASSASEWTEALAQLFENSQRRGRLGVNGLKFIQSTHSWQNCLAPLERLLTPSSVSSSSARPPVLSVEC